MSTAVATGGARPAPVIGDGLQGSGLIFWTKVWLGFGAMSLGQTLAYLDIQIVASSLTQIQSGVSANVDQISWVQTIYLLAEVVAMPLTAYMTKLWGTRPFFLVAVTVFVLSSAAAGLSTNIEAMIITRAVQGFAAGAMIPPVFATAMTIFPARHRLSVNVFTTLLITGASALGPAIGGHLTELLNWRSLFFLNVPLGALVFVLVYRFADFDRGNPSLKQGVDWLGLVLMTVFLLSMQYVLEEGADDGWFDDGAILWLSVLSVVCGVGFVYRQLTYKQPIVALHPFRNFNFTVGAVMGMIGGMSQFAGNFIIPLFLAQVLGYSSGQVGSTMVVAGLAMFLFGPFAGRIVAAVDLRIAMILGFALSGWGTLMGMSVNANWSFHEFAILQSVRSIGALVAMTAASQLSISTLPVTMMKDAAGLTSLLRNVGGAIGIAVLATVVSHQTAVHLGDLSAALDPTATRGRDMLEGLSALVAERGAPNPEGAAYKAVGMMLHRRALMMAFGDAFAFAALITFATALLSFVSRPARVAHKAQSGKP